VVRWMSPELLDPGKFGLKETRLTKESDCYALGIVVYEVLGRRKPYGRCEGPALIRKVLDGERPVRPRGDEERLFTDDIWRTIQLCWKPQPADRANARVVFLSLGGGLSLSGLASGVDGDVEKGWDDQSDATLSDSSGFSPVSLWS